MKLISKHELVKAARGKIPADTLFKNARLINVFSGNIEETNIAVHRGIVVGFGNNPGAIPDSFKIADIFAGVVVWRAFLCKVAVISFLLL